MSADFWAGYVSGAVGIVIGNPLDIIKTKLQAGAAPTLEPIVISTEAARTRVFATPPTVGTATTPLLPGGQPLLLQQSKPVLKSNLGDLVRGSAAPVLFNGALGALLYMTYNRSLSLLENGTLNPTAPGNASAWSIWTAGALGGLATFVVSAPTELVKCRAQISQTSSLEVAKDLWRSGGLRGIYMGGGITSVRDAVGYGFYFWSYELSKSYMTRPDETPNAAAMKVLLCGGLAGIVTWASIFPLDVIKTRVQTWDLISLDKGRFSPVGMNEPLTRPLGTTQHSASTPPSAFSIAQQAYKAEGISVFFRGLGVCSLRAFIVNAVQWAVYEWMMKVLVT